MVFLPDILVIQLEEEKYQSKCSIKYLQIIKITHSFTIIFKCIIDSDVHVLFSGSKVDALNPGYGYWIFKGVKVSTTVPTRGNNPVGSDSNSLKNLKFEKTYL